MSASSSRDPAVPSPPPGELHRAQAIPVRAYAFAATLRLKDLGALFPGAEVRLTHDELYALWPDGSAAVVFDFGSLVFFGVSVELRDAVVAGLHARLPAEPHPPLTEDFLVEIDPAARPPYDVRFDRVVVQELSPPVLGIVGLLLAQSAAMDYYEEDVAEILVHTGSITRDLQTRGRLRGRVPDLIKFIGSCIQTKNGIIETLALFDKPDVTWESESLDRLYIRLRELLEIGDRFRALEYKLRMIQENLVLLVDLSRQRHSIFLETGVLVLIVLELLVMIWQMVGHRGGP